MKTAVSLPDEVFAEAERLAKRLKVSRSQLYSHALQDYVRSHTPEVVTQAYDQAVARVGKQEKAFQRKAARRTFERAEW